MGAWLYKQKKSRFWWIGWRVGGKSFFRSTKQTDRAEAEKELAKVNMLFDAHKSGTLETVYLALSGRTASSVSLTVAIERWLHEVGQSTGASTARRYAVVSRSFAAFLGATEKKPLLSEVTPEHVRQFLSSSRNRLTAKTTNLKKNILSIFFNNTVREGLIRENPAKAVRAFKAKEGEESIRRAFTVEELRLLYSKSPTDFWRFMIVGGFYTGLRMGDLITLGWPSIDLSGGMIRVKSRKTKTTAHIPLAAPFRALLADLPRSQKTTGYVWPEEAKEYIARGAARFSLDFYELVLLPAGLVPMRPRLHSATGRGRNDTRRVTPVSFHSLRHSFISLLKATGGSQSVAKQLAGHAGDVMSDVYTDLPVEVLTKAIDALPMLEEK